MYDKSKSLSSPRDKAEAIHQKPGDILQLKKRKRKLSKALGSVAKGSEIVNKHVKEWKTSLYNCSRDQKHCGQHVGLRDTFCTCDTRTGQLLGTDVILPCVTFTHVFLLINLLFNCNPPDLSLLDLFIASDNLCCFPFAKSGSWEADSRRFVIFCPLIMLRKRNTS